MKKNNKYFIGILVVYLAVLVSLLIMIIPSVSRSIDEIFKYNNELLFILFLMLIIVIAMIIFMIYTIMLRQRKDDDNPQKYVSDDFLSDDRKHLEREIYSINQMLVSSEDRWNAAYQLLLSSQNKQVNQNGIISTTDFLKGFGIDLNQITIKSNLVFVLTPFHPDFENVYQVIKKACSDIKMTAIRSDEDYVKTDILKHIIKSIVEARVIVANLDGRNANVFYELGIAHALNKPTILLSNANDNVPFDVQGKYLILYNSDISLAQKLKESLLKILTSS